MRGRESVRVEIKKSAALRMELRQQEPTDIQSSVEHVEGGEKIEREGMTRIAQPD